MLKSLKNNSNGMVLITVLMVVVVMMIISIGILSRSSTQAISAEKQTERIKAEQFLKGFFWSVYTNLANNLQVASSFSASIDGRTYTATQTLVNATGGPYGTGLYRFTVNY